MPIIRPLEPTDHDYAALVAIHNAIWPDEVTAVEYMRFRDEAWPKAYFFQRLVAEMDGKIVGTVRICETHWSYRPGKYDLSIGVHPSYQQQGIGGTLYREALRLLRERPQPLTMLASFTGEDQPAAIRFLLERGFTQTMRFPDSALAVQEFDPTPFAGAVVKMKNRGIQIATLAALQERDPDWQAKIWELDCTCTQDEPLPDAYTPPTLAQYAEQEFGAPGLLPEAWFIALDGDAYIGMAVLFKDLANPQQLNAGFTAVRRAYRRQGIATALKLRTIDFAQRHGVERIVTGNEENNPMFQINLRLGFQPRPAKLAFQKEILSNG